MYKILFVNFLILFCAIAATPGAVVRKGKDFALFFPVDTYQSRAWASLNNPVKDARALAKDLEELYGFTTEVCPNYTRQQVLDKLVAYAQRSYPADGQLLIYFTGHGHFDDFAKDGYIVPADGKPSREDRNGDSYLAHSSLRRRISGIPCPHILLAADACFSGTIDAAIALKGEQGDDMDRPGEADAQRSQRIADLLRAKTRLYITSGVKDYTPDPSEFAVQFQTGLRALGGKDGLLDVQTLYHVYLKNAASRPQFGGFEGNEAGSSFLFDYRSRNSNAVSTPAPPASADRDGDGVPNTEDRCPDSPGTKANKGCPETIAAKEKTEIPPSVPDKKLAEPTPFKADNMVLIKGGTFKMGCNKEKDLDGECIPDESPIHSVTLSDFYLGRYEVTRAEWRQIMGDEPSTAGGSSRKCDQCPVESVSWNKVVQLFLTKLNAQTGLQYRLPTEAEWEYAARGGQQSKGFWFAGSDNLDEVAWYEFHHEKILTHPVGQKKPNELGLFDMNGNVWEWCSDWSGPYTSNAQKNPTGPEKGNYRIIRGGSWNAGPNHNRLSYRGSLTPTYKTETIGFRLARSL